MGARASFPILLAVGLLLGGLGMLAWWSLRSPPPANVLAVAPSPVDSSSVADAGVAPALEVPPTVAQALERDAIAAAGLDAGPGIDVQLRMEADGSAASGATLYFLGGNEQRRFNFLADFERFGLGLEFLTRHARTFSADAQGRVQVPFLPGKLQLVATRGEHFGMKSFELGSLPAGDLELSLRIAQAVEVRVCRADDRAALAGIAVRSRRVGAGQDAPIGGLSDRQGRVRLWPLFEDPNLSNQWIASVAGILREEASVRFSLEDARRGVELSLPPTDSAQVQLVDSHGAALELDGSLELHWKDSEDDWALPQEVHLSQGSANLPVVERSLLVHVLAELEGVREKPSTKFQLDAARAEPQRVVLALTQAVPIARARLLDADGAALGFADVECRLSIWRAGRTVASEFEARTRADGQFTVPLSGLELESSTAALALRVDRIPGRAALGGVFHAPLQPETTQWGELRLERAQRLFAGRVVDANGGPRPEASLVLRSAEDQGNLAAGIALNARSNANGEFELWGWSEQGLFEIEAADSGIARGRCSARRGDAAVVIRID